MSDIELNNFSQNLQYRTEEIHRLIVEKLGDVITLMNLQGVVLYVSPSINSVLGLDPEKVIGQDAFSYVYSGDIGKLRNSFKQLIAGSRTDPVEYRFIGEDGTKIWLEAKGTTINEGSTVSQILVSSRDITQRKHFEEQLKQLAYHDTLTGLPNRRLFQDRLDQAIFLAKRYKHSLSVLYLDLDDFKQVNDIHGHATGDRLLQLVAARLGNCVRELDTISRIGGDEYLLLLQEFIIPLDVAKIAERMTEVLTQPFIIDEIEISISCSIGGAFYPQDSEAADKLVECADAALYRAKAKGKNKYESYSKLNS